MPQPDEFPDLPASLTVERRGAVAVLTLSRPAKRNALDDVTIRALRAFFDAVPADVKAVVLRGAGEHFSAGLDLNEMTSRDLTAGIEHSRQWHDAFDRIQYGKVPVIGVLHGAVIGGGLEIAAACHIRVAERSTYYALPEGQRGIFVGGGGSVRLPRLIGVARMTDMMLTGRTYDAADGFAIGLSQYLVDAGQGLAKGMELAERIAANAPLTNFAVMQVLPRIAEQDAAAGLMMESLMAAIAQSDEEAKIRLRAFLENRAPNISRG
jgi:(methylthio)acryloyl-CoA hydratase